jgi:hypothetical protein
MCAERRRQQRDQGNMALASRHRGRHCDPGVAEITPPPRVRGMECCTPVKWIAQTTCYGSTSCRGRQLRCRLTVNVCRLEVPQYP